jgi:hypothetical protein
VTEEELIRRRGLLAALEHDGRGLVRADDLTDAEVEALTFGEFLGLLWRPTAEPCIDDLRDRVLMDRLVPGWAAWSLGWFRARSDPIRAMGLWRVAFLPPRDDLSFAYLTVEARRAGRVYQANRACGPHQLTETNYPPIWTLQHMLESAVEEIEQEQNRLVVSRATMTFETIEGPETVVFGPEIADLSGTIEGTIDLVDPEAIERIMEEEARRIPQRSPGGSAGLP